MSRVESARDARLSRSTVLAVGPTLAGARDVGGELLRRLLARHSVRVLDLTRAGDLRVRAERRAGDDAVTWEGSFAATVWAARLGAATHLLVIDDLTLGDDAATTRWTPRFDPADLDAYARAREMQTRECAATRSRLEREVPRFQQAFDAARQEHQRDRPLIQLGRDDSEAEAEGRYRDALQLLTARLDACVSLEARLPTVEALATRAQQSVHDSVERQFRASATFRLLEVPGAEVLWVATLARDAASESAALGALFESALDAMPGLARAAHAAPEEHVDAPLAPSGPPADARHRRHHGGRP